MATLEILYEFHLSGGETRRFPVVLDAATLSLSLPAERAWPAWTVLANRQCPNCPLADSTAMHCPMALALVDLESFSSRLDSFVPLAVTVTTPERKIHSEVTAQRAVSSLMGLLIATCACPDVSWLRPMARFHLPMASEEETIYRAASMYLLAQFMREREGMAADHDLSGLRAKYQRLHEINVAMAARLSGTIVRDASVNAVVLLDMFAKAMPYSVDDAMAELKYLFAAYLR